MDNKKARTNLLRRYPKRHIALAVALVLLCAYYALREVRVVADFATTYIAFPWHHISGRIHNFYPFSVAEWLCALAGVGVLAYILVTLYKIIREPKKLQRLYAAVVTLLAAALLAYSHMCWLWGIGFYSHTYTELSGIETNAIRVEELKEVTIYFAEVATAAAEAVNRDENGLYVCDIQNTFNDAPGLYADLPGEFDFLQGPEIHPKPMVFSYIMSHMNFTGVFFPLTGEANINICTPDCFIPSTVAHELAHQHGVIREQDANFTAVLVCMESGDADFVYSGALLAYVHLAHSLREASYADWEEASSHLGESVRRDLLANSEYWAEFNTPAAQVSEAAYEEFLHNQGQELGMRSYGACVDMLVTYYGRTVGTVRFCPRDSGDSGYGQGYDKRGKTGKTAHPLRTDRLCGIDFPGAELITWQTPRWDRLHQCRDVQPRPMRPALTASGRRLPHR